MPKNPLEDLKWLPELVKSEDERLDIIERLGFPIIEQDAEGFVHIPLFPSQSKRDEDLLQEFINGKWRFMIAACTMRKRFPDKRQETTTRGLMWSVWMLHFPKSEKDLNAGYGNLGI